MTSPRKIEANRRNALNSTGPNTQTGKNRSRRNAIRHGLCAETVIDAIEDVKDYHAFEAAVLADYVARTAVERELVLRVASLLWRLRRATSIETGLLQTYSDPFVPNKSEPSRDENGLGSASSEPFSKHDISKCFSHLARTEGSTFERLNRYEHTLWRQLHQTLSTLRLLAWQQRRVPKSKNSWWSLTKNADRQYQNRSYRYDAFSDKACL
jgi:hypothetical protein